MLRRVTCLGLGCELHCGRQGFLLQVADNAVSFSGSLVLCRAFCIAIAEDLQSDYC